jgi:hypothetical protein
VLLLEELDVLLLEVIDVLDDALDVLLLEELDVLLLEEKTHDSCIVGNTLVPLVHYAQHARQQEKP